MWVEQDDEEYSDYIDEELTSITGTLYDIKEYPKDNGAFYRAKITGSPDTTNSEYKKYLRKHDAYVAFFSRTEKKAGDCVTLVGNVQKTYFDDYPKAYSMSLEVKFQQDGPFTYETLEDIVKPYANAEDLKIIIKSAKARHSALRTFIDLSRGDNSTILPKVSDNCRYGIETLMNSDANSMAETIVVAQLQPYLGKRNSFAKQMYYQYGCEALQYMKKNPWDMLLTIDNIRLAKCDEVAEKLGIPLTDERRLNTMVVKAVRDTINNSGYTYLPKDMIATVYYSYFSEQCDYDTFIEKLTKNPNYIIECDYGYQPTYLYNAENEIFYGTRILSQKQYTVDNVDEIVSDVEAENESPYEHNQYEAIKTSLTTGLFLLTGGPGTGKTYTLDGILRAHYKAFDWKPENILAMAPTGKAAQRMMSQTGLSAYTIHLALGFKPGELEIRDFIISKYKDVQLIVVDEASMLDTVIASKVIEIACKLNAKVVFIGDVNQLPSVSAGQVFKDLLQVFPSIELNVVKRQASDSNILELAYKTINGKFPDIEWFNTKPDVFFFQQTRQELPKTVVDILAKKRAKDNDLRDVQILTPYANQTEAREYDTALELSKLSQLQFNPDIGQKHIVDGTSQYRIGDRVISKRNYPFSSIVNGSIGRISDIYNTGDVNQWLITVDYSEDVLGKTLDELTLALRQKEALTQAIELVEQFKIFDNTTTSDIINDRLQKFKDVAYTIFELTGRDFTQINLSEIPKPQLDVLLNALKDEVHKYSTGCQMTYEIDDWDKFELANAITIHKSQGSEYENIIIPIARHVSAGNSFLTRNLLYTAITRAKSKVILLGDINSYKQISQNKPIDRLTGLQQLFNKGQ